MTGMMEMPSVAQETLTLGQALAVGAALGLYYDIFRILRRLFKFGYAAVVAQDIFFWVTSAIGVFFATIWFSGGVLRIYFVAASLVGWGIYAATAGVLLMFFVDKTIKMLTVVWNGFKKKILCPIKNKLLGQLKKLQLKKYLENLLKKFPHYATKRKKALENANSDMYN